MNTMTQRDAFWNSLFELAKKDKDIVAVIADMGAPALDRFRQELPWQLIDVGIAEQQAIAVASGLALEGKKVFVYAIAPFITLRCYEHIRVNLAAMNLPVTIVGVGAGMSYDDSGPTHHAVDDLSALRILPNLKIHNITDSNMASAFAGISCSLKSPNYVRLDRKILPSLYKADDDFDKGLAVLEEGAALTVIATGNMVHQALAVQDYLLKNNQLKIGVIDVFTFPVNHQHLITALADVQRIVTLEEHNLAGGLGGMIAELFLDHGITTPVTRMGLDCSNGYCYQYGGRVNLQKSNGLDTANIAEKIKALIQG